jgi:LDH2 family malate/lactate/ureidoglycolate dehydrogenase
MRVPKDNLKKGVVEILISFGESPEGAERVADCLIKADMRGVSTHGTYLLKPISDRAKIKMLTLPTKPEFVMNDGATALIDGKNGLGPVAGYLAIQTGIEKAKQYGISTVLIRNTNNIGSLAYYTQFAADANMVSIMACNAAPAMAPWGGAEQFIGTNPIAISIPTGPGTCFTADMASSVVARGKIRKASRQNTPIPDNWALDKDGNPTTDPNAALKGALLPMGGPKGSALALWVDILSGLISGSSYSTNLKSFHTAEGGPTGVGAFCITMDVNRFMAISQFSGLMDSYVGDIKKMKKAKGFDEILMPGEIELRKEQDSLKQGVELDAQTITDINAFLAGIGSKTKVGS